MAIDNQQLKIDPYTSTVPLVQLPPQEMEAGTRPAGPLQGQFGKAGTGALAIGDSIIKGLIQGHQMKEQRKVAEANATIAAADKSVNDTYQQYQDALRSNKPPAETDAAYKVYLDTFNKSKEAKAKFILPEEGAKKPKKGGVKGAAEGAVGGIKEFFAANPHVIPSIALMTMQPKPPGSAPETTQAKASDETTRQSVEVGGIELGEAQRRQAAEKTVDKLGPMFNVMTETEIAALPPDVKKQYGEYIAARDILNPQRSGTGSKLYVDGSGAYHWRIPGQEYPGETAAPPTAGQPRMGTEQFATSNYLAQHNIDPKNASPELLKYLHDYWNWKQAQTSQSTSGSTVDVHGNRTTTNTTTRGAGEPKAVEPKPPAGFAPMESTAGAMTAPPTAPTGKGEAKTAAAKTKSGGLTPPPQKSTLTDANRTEKVETQKRDRYQKAQDKFDKIMEENRKAKGKDETFDVEAANKAALATLEAEHKEIEKWYTLQVHSVGGKTAADTKYKHMAKDAKGNIYGTNDGGKTWFDTKTGNPYQEQ